MDRYYHEGELRALGLTSVGYDVQVDRTAILVNPAGISIGNQTRIDAFCLISAVGPGVTIGSHVHLSAGVYIFGGAGVWIEDFVSVSARCLIYSVNDDYSGEHLVGPTLPAEFRDVDARTVRIGRHAVVGAGSVVLPGVTFGEGSACGSLSLVKQDVTAFTIVAGAPARVVKGRSRRLLELEAQYLRGQNGARA